LQECPARQKVLILDVPLQPQSRSRTARQRSGGGAGGQGRSALGPNSTPCCSAPAAWVWSSPHLERSIEYDNAYLQNGVFLEALQEVVTRGVDGVIQKPEESIPLAALVEKVNARMKQLLDPLGKKQVSRLTGVEAVSSVAYDPEAPAAPEPKVKLPAGAGEYASEKQVEEILSVTSVPPVKLTRSEMMLRARSLPPFEAKTLAMYPLDSKETEFRTAVKKAQKVLQESMTGKRLPEEYTKPGGNVADRSRRCSRTSRPDRCAGAGDAGGDAGGAEGEGHEGAREAEMSKGWLATADYIKARLESQIAYFTSISGSDAGLPAAGRERPQRLAARGNQGGAR
jgi:hypothetical protein